jgi:hypothetical protein
MPRPTLQAIKPFTIPALGYGFVDRSTLSDLERGLTSETWRHWLIDEYESKQDDRRQRMGICDEDLAKQDRFRAEYLRRAEANSDYSWDDFEQDGGTVEFDQDFDPRLPQAHLAIFEIETGGIVGQMPLMNIQIEHDEVGGMSARCQGTPGVKPGPGLSRAETWSIIYNFILENDVTFVDGRVLDIVEWVYPQDLEGFRFKAEDWNDLEEVFDGVRSHGHQEERSTIDPDAVRSFRRAGVPK